jgi:hypothetical protein
MKTRFYCDIPSNGVRASGANAWTLYASTQPSTGIVAQGFTRVAFDVELPPDLVLPPHDVMAPADKAVVMEEKK